jgi:hypothetical protein
MTDQPDPERSLFGIKIHQPSDALRPDEILLVSPGEEPGSISATLLKTGGSMTAMKTVWAVRYGNYDPSEVIALYDNEQAARAHAELSDDPLEVEEMEVRSKPPQLSGGPLST